MKHTMDNSCDHDWKEVDESFDHEFGTKRIYYMRCNLCDATRELAPGDYCMEDE